MRLRKEMAIIVPSTKRFNERVSKAEVKRRVREVRDFLTNTFGGTTRIRGTGSYASFKRKKIVDEPVVVVECFADSGKWMSQNRKVVDFIERKAKEWGQENIGFEFETDMFLVEPKGAA